MAASPSAKHALTFLAPFLKRTVHATVVGARGLVDVRRVIVAADHLLPIYHHAHHAAASGTGSSVRTSQILVLWGLGVLGGLWAPAQGMRLCTDWVEGGLKGGGGLRCVLPILTTSSSNKSNKVRGRGAHLGLVPWRYSASGSCRGRMPGSTQAVASSVPSTTRGKRQLRVWEGFVERTPWAGACKALHKAACKACKAACKACLPFFACLLQPWHQRPPWGMHPPCVSPCVARGGTRHRLT